MGSNPPLPVAVVGCMARSLMLLEVAPFRPGRCQTRTDLTCFVCWGEGGGGCIGVVVCGMGVGWCTHIYCMWVFVCEVWCAGSVHRSSPVRIHTYINNVCTASVPAGPSRGRPK